MGVCSRVYATTKSVYEVVEEELSSFKKEPIVPLDVHPFIIRWWKVNVFKYPLITKVAKYSVGVPGTSDCVPSEPVFSTAGEVVTTWRALLNADNVDQLIFLKCNLTFKAVATVE